MEKVLVLDFGGHYNQPIARKVREQNVYAEIVSYQKITADEIVAQGYKGIIFTGGPDSVFEPDAPHCDSAIRSAGLVTEVKTPKELTSEAADKIRNRKY